MITAIACVGKNYELGKNNDLCFRSKADMTFFKQITSNNIVAMGENTLLSFPKSKPLKNRINIVLCPEGHDYNDCICLHDFEQTVKVLKLLATQYDVYIIGGAMFYKSMLPYCDRVYLTKVDAEDKDATVFFPNIDNMSEFELTRETDTIFDSGYNLKFLTYTKKNLLN